MSATKFWLEEPCILITDFVVIPTSSMTKNQKLNALTRLVLIGSAILYAIDYKHWLTFLVASLMIIIFLAYGIKDSSNSVKQTDIVEPVNDDSSIENFTLTPTFLSVSNPNQTTVAPLFAEEWQIYPPAYDTQTELCTYEGFEEPLTPQQYPYGQYLTSTNLLPSDEYYVRQMNGGSTQAREYVNGAFTRNALASRDNMTRIIKKKMARRYRQNYNDTVSPFTSY